MNVPKHIKRFWMWVGIALLIELAAIMLWKRWYWFFPTHAVSGVYTKYAGTDGLNVVFFKDFKVNDTLFLDVTLLEAKDSAGWATLKTDFSIPDLPPDFQQIIDNGNELILTKKIPRQQDPLQQDTSGMIYDMAAIALQMHTVSIFHTKNLDERLAVVNHNFENNEKQFTK